MGLLDPGRSHSYTEGGGSRAHSPARSTHSSSKGYFVRPSASHSRNHSSRGLFNSSSSSYKRSPRQGYLQYLYNKLRRLLRELWHYARRHPLKAFFAVVVPLLSAGGAVGGLMRQFGIRMPGLDGGRRGGGSSGYGGLGGGGGGGGGLMENAGSLVQIAKAFM